MLEQGVVPVGVAAAVWCQWCGASVRAEQAESEAEDGKRSSEYTSLTHSFLQLFLSGWMRTFFSGSSITICLHKEFFFVCYCLYCLHYSHMSYTSDLAETDIRWCLYFCSPDAWLTKECTPSETALFLIINTHCYCRLWARRVGGQRGLSYPMTQHRAAQGTAPFPAFS